MSITFIGADYGSGSDRTVYSCARCERTSEGSETLGNIYCGLCGKWIMSVAEATSVAVLTAKPGRAKLCAICNKPATHHHGDGRSEDNRWCPKPGGGFASTKYLTAY